MEQNKTSSKSYFSQKVLRHVGKSLFKYASFVLFSTSMAVQAADSPSEKLLSLHNLLKNKEYSEAFSLSKVLLEEHGGEPIFDFYAGTAAYHSGHFQEAMFAFERVMFNRPAHMQARLLLAFSYFRVKNYGAAKVELNGLLKKSDQIEPKNIKRIKDYLAQIKESEQKAIRDSSFKVSLGVGYDSNVNSGTATDSIFFPSLGDFIIITEGVEKEDALADVSLTYRLQEKLSQKSSYTLQANFSHLYHQDNSEFDRSVMNFSGGYTGMWQSMKYNVTGYVQPMLLNDKFYRTAYGLMTDGSWQLGDKWLWTLGLNTAHINNNTQDTQDMRRVGISTKITYLDTHPQILEIFFTDDDADKKEGEHNGKDYYGFAYTYLLLYSNQLNFALRLNADKVEYDKIHPTFLDIRKDDTVSATLTTNYQFNTEWQFSTMLRYSDKNSNLEIYEYDRAEFKLSASRIF